jgi:hypothetical protein
MLAPGLRIAGAGSLRQMRQERAPAWAWAAHELGGPGKCSLALGVVLTDMPSHQMLLALLALRQVVLRQADAEARDATLRAGDTLSGRLRGGNGEVREHLLGAPGR